MTQEWEVFESSRDFVLWDSTVSHKRMLLRSTCSDKHETRIDIAFKPVDALHLQTSLSGLSIRRATSEEASEILARLDGSLRDRNVFICDSGTSRGYVVAAVFEVVEDRRAYHEPSGTFFTFDEAEPV